MFSSITVALLQHRVTTRIAYIATFSFFSKVAKEARWKSENVLWWRHLVSGWKIEL